MVPLRCMSGGNRRCKLYEVCRHCLRRLSAVDSLIARLPSKDQTYFSPNGMCQPGLVGYIQFCSFFRVFIGFADCRRSVSWPRSLFSMCVHAFSVRSHVPVCHTRRILCVVFGRMALPTMNSFKPFPMYYLVLLSDMHRALPLDLAL